MGRLGVLLFASPIQHRTAETALGLVEAAARQGHSATVFLLGDAVYLASRALADADPEGVVRRFEALPASVELVSCTTCARFRGLRDESLVRNARSGTLEDLVDLIGSSDRFLSLTGDG